MIDIKLKDCALICYGENESYVFENKLGHKVATIDPKYVHDLVSNFEWTPPPPTGKKLHLTAKEFADGLAGVSRKLSADRHNQGKPQWHLVDFDALLPLVGALEYGAKKYSPNNWKKGLPQQEILDCLLRHVFALLAGESHDKESGVHHIGHVMANAMFYSYF